MLSAVGVAQAAPVNYVFDTITYITSGYNARLAGITGVLRNDTAPTSLQIYTPDSARYNSCLPLLLTMMEKPGRYYLIAVVDTSEGYTHGLQSCGLQLR